MARRSRRGATGPATLRPRAAPRVGLDLMKSSISSVSGPGPCVRAPPRESVLGVTTPPPDGGVEEGASIGDDGPDDVPDAPAARPPSPPPSTRPPSKKKPPSDAAVVDGPGGTTAAAKKMKKKKKTAAATMTSSVSSVSAPRPCVRAPPRESCQCRWYGAFARHSKAWARVAESSACLRQR